jgi:pimeloyl-ACP methyl ester carboxylesterase
LPPDYRIAQVAQDCINLADELGIISACVVGHSWGASVALHIAAKFPLLSRSCVLIDGGAFTPANILESGSITREALIIALTPPLGPFAENELNTHYLSSHLGLSAQQQRSVMSAIKRSYTPAPQGGWVTTIGFERHMAVVEAFLEYNPDSDLTSVEVPTWILMARDAFAPSMTHSMDSWADARAQVKTKVRGKSNIALQHWYGAVHDVPLYWPIQVSQLISHAVSYSEFTPELTSAFGGKDTLA